MQDASDSPEFSALVTCHFEEKSIDEFHSRLKAALESLGRSYEIVMVNDGSTDGTWQRLKEIFERDPNVRVILDFAKNAGQRAATTAGIEHARGRAFILMDSDLQMAPEELPALVAEYDKGWDLVTGYRVNRHDSLTRILPSKLANIVMRKASGSTIRDFGCTFKIYNADIVRAFKFGPNRVFSNVELIAGVDRIKEIPITHHPRKYGKSGWTFRKLWKYNMENIVLLLERPFQYIALFCALFGALLVLRIAISVFSEFTILIEVTNGLLLNAIAVTLLVTTTVLALIGEFSVRSFAKLLNLPAYIVREKVEK